MSCDPFRLRPAPLLAVTLLIGCGAGSSGGAAQPGAPVPPAASACKQSDVGDCLAQARRECHAGASVYQLHYSTQPPITVGPNRLIRLDDLGGTFYGTDSTHWLACYAQCPEGGPQRICFPIEVPLHLAWTAGHTCSRQTHPAPPWRGRKSSTLTLDCGGGDRSSLRFVPALTQVQSNLVAAGAIDADDPLARTDGLVVEMSADGVVQSQLEQITPAPAGCGAFDAPAGYRMLDDQGAFTALEQVAPPHADKLAVAVSKIQAKAAEDAVKQAKARLLPQFRQKYGERCRASGHDPAVDAQLEACVAALPETEEPFRRAVSRASAQLLASKRPELNALTEKLLVAPLCRHYAGQ